MADSFSPFSLACDVVPLNRWSIAWIELLILCCPMLLKMDVPCDFLVNNDIPLLTLSIKSMLQ